MRQIFWLTLALLPATSPANDIYVREPIVHLVRSADLPSRCGTPLKVEACTAFAGQILACACEKSEDGWRIEPRAQFIPVMYLTGAEHVAHERQHIADIEHSLKRYLRDLRSLRFDGAEQCEEIAQEYRSRFPRTMDTFKEESNDLRHPRHRRTGTFMAARRSIGSH